MPEVIKTKDQFKFMFEKAVDSAIEVYVRLRSIDPTLIAVTRTGFITTVFDLRGCVKEQIERTKVDMKRMGCYAYVFSSIAVMIYNEKVTPEEANKMTPQQWREVGEPTLIIRAEDSLHNNYLALYKIEGENLLEIRRGAISREEVSNKTELRNVFDGIFEDDNKS